MPIPLLDLKRQYAAIREEVLQITEEIYESQAFILGKRVEEFERDFATYCHAKRAIGVSSGTDALLIALMVLGVEPGDEVIVPAYSFFATAGVVERIGAIPVFVDIDPRDFNLDPKLIEREITKRTKAIIPVHLYGQTADMEAINAIGEAKKIAVVEDAAQAVGAEFDGKRAGTLSILGCFSYFPSKNLGAFGDAGAVTTNDEALAEKLVDYRVHGMRPKYFHQYVGGNFRIDALQAAILHVKLRYLEEWTKGRQRNAERYRELFAQKKLTDRVILPETMPRRRHVYNQYIIRFASGRDTRDRVLAHLKDQGIGCEIYYPLPLPDQECFKHLPSAKNSFPESEKAANQTLAIPIFPELSDDELSTIVDEIAKAL